MVHPTVSTGTTPLTPTTALPTVTTARAGLTTVSSLALALGTVLDGAAGATDAVGVMAVDGVTDMAATVMAVVVMATDAAVTDTDVAHTDAAVTAAEHTVAVDTLVDAADTLVVHAVAMPAEREADTVAAHEVDLAAAAMLAASVAAAMLVVAADTAAVVIGNTLATRQSKVGRASARPTFLYADSL